MLYIFSGLPGVGKTTLAKHLATVTQSAYLRIDSIEQSIKDKGYVELYDEGYRIAQAIALENLKLGRSVVADSTNPVPESRQAWRQVAEEASADFVNIEVVCSDLKQHQYRIEHRHSDIAGLQLPSWDDVTCREYVPWATPPLRIDTANQSPEQSTASLAAALADYGDK